MAETTRVFAIQTPDGRQIRIRAADPASAVKAAQAWIDAHPPAATAGSLARSAVSGAASAINDLRALNLGDPSHVSDVLSAMNQGGRLLAQTLGGQTPRQAEAGYQANEAQRRKYFPTLEEDDQASPLHFAPRNEPERLASAIGSMVPNAFGGEATIPLRAARVAIPGLMSEGARHLAQGLGANRAWQTAAQIAGGLAGGGATAVSPTRIRAALNAAKTAGPELSVAPEAAQAAPPVPAPDRTLRFDANDYNPQFNPNDRTAQLKPEELPPGPDDVFRRVYSERLAKIDHYPPAVKAMFKDSVRRIMQNQGDVASPSSLYSLDQIRGMAGALSKASQDTPQWMLDIGTDMGRHYKGVEQDLLEMADRRPQNGANESEVYQLKVPATIDQDYLKARAGRAGAIDRMSDDSKAILNQFEDEHILGPALDDPEFQFAHPDNLKDLDNRLAKLTTQYWPQGPAGREVATALFGLRSDLAALGQRWAWRFESPEDAKPVTAADPATSDATATDQAAPVEPTPPAAPAGSGRLQAPPFLANAMAYSPVSLTTPWLSPYATGVKAPAWAPNAMLPSGSVLGAQSGQKSPGL